MKKLITIEIDDQGSSSIDLDGFQGKGCEEVMQAFRGAHVVKAARQKPEYTQQTSTSQEKQGQ